LHYVNSYLQRGRAYQESRQFKATDPGGGKNLKITLSTQVADASWAEREIKRANE
jgi:hypothetical protein